ncbi:hypothetical protein [Floridanema evergladense]|uniref:Uncharacterized protein n=1 Tax=Floridaenema evergladense BLCC-F167 TaxID=3153639 RepID=A0ABV4WN72_9CYAN
MKTYKIITLGASGAGKTVFLASMFKALSIQGDHGFYLEVEDQNKRKLLNSIYTQVITGDSWPQGTKYSEVSEWTFTCHVKTPSLDDYPACQFTYFDYAGGRLTDVDEDEEFEGIVKQADAILGLLDGQKIHAWMSGSNELAADSFLKKDLPSILKLMLSCKVPIHFALSKWDLLENEFSLNQVLDRFCEIPEFEQLVRGRNKAGSPVRLIPVSSVGSSFVTPAPDGSMKKISGAIPRPFQVEVPLACVLPDHLTAWLNQVSQKREQLEAKDLKQPNIITMFFNLAEPVINTVTEIGTKNLSNLEGSSGEEDTLTETLAKKLVSNLINFGFQNIKKAADKRAKIIQEQINESLKNVRDEETALTHAIKRFVCIQHTLSQTYPQSEIIL